MRLAESYSQGFDPNNYTEPWELEPYVMYDELGIRYQAVTEELPGELQAEVLDEIRSARERQPSLHIVVTGRDAPKELVEAADLVTEMTEVKHPFQAGIRAQKGIEF